MKNLVSRTLKPAIGVCVLTVLSALLAFNIYTSTERKNKATLQAQAHNIAANISAHRLEQLKDNLGSIRKQLKEAKETIPECKSIYILEKTGPEIKFLVDVSTIEEAKLGEVYTDASLQLFTNIRKGKSFIEGPIPDKWGNWVSAFAPVARNQDTMVGIDVDASDWSKQQLRSTMPTIIAMAVLILLLLLLPVAAAIKSTILETIVILGIGGTLTALASFAIISNELEKQTINYLQLTVGKADEIRQTMLAIEQSQIAIASLISSGQSPNESINKIHQYQEGIEFSWIPYLNGEQVADFETATKIEIVNQAKGSDHYPVQATTEAYEVGLDLASNQDTKTLLDTAIKTGTSQASFVALHDKLDMAYPSKSSTHTGVVLAKINLKDLSNYLTYKPAKDSPTVSFPIFTGETTIYLRAPIRPQQLYITTAIIVGLIVTILVAWIVRQFRLQSIRLEKAVKQRTAELEKSEAAYRKQFKNNTSKMLLINPDTGEIVEANNAAIAYYEWDPAGHSIAEINGVALEDWIQAAKHIQEHGARIQFTHRKASGELRDVDVSFSRINTEKASLLHAIIHDITDKKHAEGAVRVSDVALRAVSQGVIVADSSRRILSVNTAFTKITGYTQDEVLGKPCKFLQGKDTDPATIKKISSALKAGKNHSCEILNYTKSGNQFWNELTIAIVSSNGEITHYIGVLRDITERKTNELEIAEATARLQLATRAGGVGVWDYNINTGNLTWDDQMYKLYGLEKQPDKTTYDIWTDHIHAEDRQRITAEVQMAIYGTKEYDTEFRIIKKDKTVRTIRALAVVRRNHEGKAERMVGTNWDITEQKEGEEKLLAANQELIVSSEKAKLANAAKSEFLANMSHEIRTPMNGVIGLTELLKDTPLNKEQKEYVSALKTSGEALMDIINDILDISKIEAGKIEIEKIDFDIYKCLSDFSSMVVVRAQSKELKYTCEIESNIPEYIIGDPSRIRQVLLNLVGNAIKFTKSGGVKVKATKNVDTIKFEIKDTGIGIPSEKQQMLFQKFSQIDSSTTRLYGGSGLGLAISKQLVKLMGGEIGVQSTVGNGSTFWFTIPLVTGSKPKQEASKVKPSASLAGKTILVVEDNHINQQVVCTVLSKAGATTTTAQTGAEALQILDNRKFDIVLMDIQMPVMDGLTATKEIRARNNNIPIIAMTANAAQGDQEECLAAGMNGYISKPISPQTVISAIIKLTTKDAANMPAIQPNASTALLTDWNKATFMERVMDDSNLATTILECAIQELEPTLKIVQSAIETDNKKDIKALAHTIKGLAANISAELLSFQAAELEKNYNAPKHELTRHLEELTKAYHRFVACHKNKKS